jgi:hypothetical protein
VQYSITTLWSIVNVCVTLCLNALDLPRVYILCLPLECMFIGVPHFRATVVEEVECWDLGHVMIDVAKLLACTYLLAPSDRRTKDEDFSRCRLDFLVHFYAKDFICKWLVHIDTMSTHLWKRT